MSQRHAPVPLTAPLPSRAHEAATTSWTGWAVSSLASKLYKPSSGAHQPSDTSSPAPPGPSKSQELVQPVAVKEACEGVWARKDVRGVVPVLCVCACVCILLQSALVKSAPVMQAHSLVSLSTGGRILNHFIIVDMMSMW